MNYKESILELSNLDLSKYPHSEIKELIHCFGHFGLLQFNFHPGKIIHRARVNHGDERFFTREALQYKPSHLNSIYQRASIPNETMFYGGIIPENIRPDELSMGRVIACAEVTPLLRDKFTKGIEKLTFSKWEVIQDIPLIGICYKEDIKDLSSHSTELYNAYMHGTSLLPDDEREKSNSITDFIASEFAKSEITGDYDYMISAIFSHITVSKGMGGVYYPSVRVGYKGYNVALSPIITNKCLRLVAAGEGTLFKNGDRSILFNESVVKIDDDNQPFSYMSIEHTNPKSKEQIKKELGLM